MAFTYSGDPATSMRDALRFQVDDTDPQLYDMEDAELDFILSYFGVNPNSAGTAEGVFPAVLEAMRMKARRMAADPTVRIGNLTVDNTAAAREYAERLKQFQARLASRSGLWAGGISVAEKLAAQQDSDRPGDSFRVGIHDFPGAQPPNEKPDPTTGP